MTALGTFEPGFYGITVIHDNQDDMSLVASFLAADDDSAWRHAPGASLGTIGMLSAHDHEFRHFHDFLISPTGAAMTALQVEASINGMQAIMSIRRCPQRYLPVPVARWMGWDEAARTRWVATTGRHFGIDDVADFVPLPTPEGQEMGPGRGPRSLDGLEPERQMALQVEATILNFAMAARVRRAKDFGRLGSFSADDAFEGSAHIVQGQAVWQAQGEEAAGQYFAHLDSAALSHLRSFSLLLDALCRHAAPLTTLRLGELYTWMLLTPPSDSLEKGSPATRYAAILLLARTHPDLLLADMSTERLWNALDRASGQSAWRLNLDDSLGRLEAKRQNYAALRDQCYGEPFEGLFATADMWLGDSILATRAFLADPAAYANPLTYVNETAQRLPPPFIRIHFDNQVDRSEMPLDSGWRAIRSDDDPRAAIAYVVSMRSDLPDDCLDEIIWAMMVNFFVDYCFHGEPEQCALNRYLQDSFRGVIGKEVVHVY